MIDIYVAQNIGRLKEENKRLKREVEEARNKIQSLEEQLFKVH